MLLLNVTNSKSQIFMQKYAKTGTISKLQKKLPKWIVSVNRKFVSRQQLEDQQNHYFNELKSLSSNNCLKAKTEKEIFQFVVTIAKA